jgi:hypothetical protein
MYLNRNRRGIPVSVSILQVSSIATQVFAARGRKLYRYVSQRSFRVDISCVHRPIGTTAKWHVLERDPRATCNGAARIVVLA